MTSTPLVERTGEELTRFIDRRAILKRAAIGVFGLTAAWAVDLIHVPRAEAINYCQYTESGCSCDPPNGTYCGSLNLSYCSGPNCAGGCTFNYKYYPTACWCTDVCCGSHGGYYYECCDCFCNGQECGCRGTVQTGGCRQTQ